MTSQCYDVMVTSHHVTRKGSWEMTALSPWEYVNEKVSSLVVTCEKIETVTESKILQPRNEKGT